MAASLVCAAVTFAALPGTYSARIGQLRLDAGALRRQPREQPLGLPRPPAQRRGRRPRLRPLAPVVAARRPGLRPGGRARPLGQQGTIVVEIALERHHLAVGHQPQPVGHQFDQMRIVGDQHHRALEVGQRPHQRLARIDVEMVARLVEDQQLRRLAGGQRQQQPRFFAPRQVGHRVSARSASSPNRASCARTCARSGARQRPRHVLDRGLRRRPAPPPGAGRNNRPAAAGRAAPRPASERAGRRSAWPASTCRCRWRRAARCGRPCRSAARARSAPACRHSPPPPGPAPGSAGRCRRGAGKSNRVGASSTTVSIAGSRAIALSRACAWRALLAL